MVFVGHCIKVTVCGILVNNPHPSFNQILIRKITMIIYLKITYRENALEIVACRNLCHKLVEMIYPGKCFNTLRPRQNGRLFADDTFKRIFLNENIRISIKNSLKFVPKGLINNSPALVLIMAWRRLGDKPLSEPMMVRSLTQICVTRPQWGKISTTPI